ncbi:MAG: iron uptake system protein EfeO [Ancalomicrobiaceae bacterium]|nr:iron uptake system protein EfeO [Ancalomicrobiaceae bacterium]
MKLSLSVSAAGFALLGACGVASAASVIAPADLVAPIADYKIYVAGEVDALVKATHDFTEAVKAGDLAKAQALYAPTRVHYERIEPVADQFSDLDKSIDVRADDFAAKEADPNFTGFHRIEYGLYAKKSTDALGPLADKLLADVTELQSRIQGLTLPPGKVVGGAAELVEEIAKTKISGEEDRYSRTDLWDFKANVDGARQIVSLLQPLTSKANAKLQTRLDDNFTKVEAILTKYSTAGDGFESYDALSKKDRTALRGPVTALAEDLSKLRGVLGVK